MDAKEFKLPIEGSFSRLALLYTQHEEAKNVFPPTKINGKEKKKPKKDRASVKKEK